ncbi:MAG: DUF3299 domain-containing protein [Mangrovicoccus sp.]|nr:DUF3299 domain-containing protein [Mangrovicoccus sp.]
MPAFAREAIDLDWSDLVPSEAGMALDELRAKGVIQHGELSTPFDQDLGGTLTDAFDGKLVRLPGFMLPLDYDGLGVTAFLLVPYMGACIHVPPPPPNQLVFVTLQRPYESKGLFEPVYVTGVFGAAATATELADVGYAIQSGAVSPFDQ